MSPRSTASIISIITLSSILTLGVFLSGCALSPATKANLVTDGQLFCAKATADGPLVVALVNLAGVPVIATDAAKEVVDQACGAVNAIAVSPPANPAAAPIVAVAMDAITALPDVK